MKNSVRLRVMFTILVTAVVLVSLLVPFPLNRNLVKAETVAAKVKISDFEDMSQWGGLAKENTIVHEGAQSGQWQVFNPDTQKYTAASASNIPHDWSGQEALRVWVYSKKATGARIYTILNSDNPDTSAANEYYFNTFTVDWEGWKELVIPFTMFSKSVATVVGFNKIDSIKFSANWRGETPDTGTQLIFDDISIDQMQSLDRFPIDSFEDMAKWTSLTADKTHVKDGTTSGKWTSINTKTAVRTTAIPEDWSKYDYLQVWLYSEKATGTAISVILDSDDPSAVGADYYISSIKVDWTGWKQVSLPLKDFAPSRNPLGMNHIQRLTFHSKWYADSNPDPTTVLYFDSLELYREAFKVNPATITKQVIPGTQMEYSTVVSNKSNESDDFSVQIPQEWKDQVTVDHEVGTLAPGESKQVTFHVSIPQDAEAGDEKSVTIPITSKRLPGEDFAVSLSYQAADWKSSDGQHPNAFYGKDDIDRARQRIQTVEWAKDYWNKVKAEADPLLSADLTVPSEGGGHPTWYLCDDGSPLVYDSGKPFEHYCPADKKVYTGASYDAAWRYYRNDELVRELKTLATAYSLSQDQAYAEKAKVILLGYADVYPNYPLQSRGGRLDWQTLDEAVSMIDVANAYDLLYDSGVFTTEDKANIELNFLKPSALTISQYDMDKSNWQAWHDSAIGTIGFAIGNKDLIDLAINGKHGFNYLMKESVLSDGFWWEGTIAYHMYALTPLNILAEGAKHWGYDLYANPSLKNMFDVPINYAYPNLTLPANNDGGQFGSTLVGAVSPDGFNEYEAAFAYYQDPNYAWVLNERYNVKHQKREGDFALFKGVDDIPVSTNADIQSRDFNGVGHAVVRSGVSPNQNYILMDYGPHGGSHGHPDKLNIDVYGAGAQLAPDFGTPSYGHPLYPSWYKQTLSHNTVVVDGASQSASEGVLDTFVTQPNLKIMRAEANGAYPGVHYERTIWMQDQYAVDWFQVSDPNKAHQYDWVMHGLGDFSTNLSLTDRTEKLGTKDGYELLTNVKSTNTDQTWEGSWNQKNAGLHIVSLPNGSREVVTADGPGPSNHPDQNTTLVIQRQTGNDAQFVTVLQPTSSTTENLAAVKEGENGLKIDLSGQTDHLFYRTEAEDGGLLAGKVTTAKGYSFDFSESVKSRVSNNVLSVSINTELELSSLTLMYHAPGISKVLVNGAEVDLTRDGENIIINLKAFATVKRLTGVPVTGSLSFSSSMEPAKLAVVGVEKNPTKLNLNGKDLAITAAKNVIELEITSHLVSGVNELKWEVRGIPGEKVDLFVE